MNVHVLCNQGHRVLLQRYFRASLKDDWSIHEHALGLETACDYGTPGYKEIVREKIAILVDDIIPFERASTNSHFLLSDVDIQFFGRCDLLIRQSLLDRDMVFQSELGGRGGEVNTGFIAMKPVPRVKEFWEAVLRVLDGYRSTDTFTGNQRIVNEILRAGAALRWGVFPDEIWAWTNRALRPYDEGFSRILVHHANFTLPRPSRSSLDLKIEQLDLVARILRNWESTPRRERALWKNYARVRGWMDRSSDFLRKITSSVTRDSQRRS